ncbi:MAG: guanylate kinase [Lachnospiraceae bacterium]|nr:guanylate kinase [Lachnospiraceae bacterium]
MKRTGVLMIVSGFSGAGKGTLMKRLLESHDNYALSISMTTRAPRPGEIHGKHYFFVEKDEFEKTIAEDGLIEYAQYCGNYYGTPKSYVEQCLNEGRDVILEIEIQGALKVKKKFPEAVLVFVTPPSAMELRNRLIGRGTETKEVIDKRLSRAVEEAQGIENYDYIVINDELDRCVEDIHAIVMALHCKTNRSISIIEEISKELNEISKGEEK